MAVHRIQKPMDRELITCLAKARYLSKRTAGISNTRSDGSECSIDNDIDATGAEFFAAQEYGRPFDSSIGKKGDGGSDFTIPLTVEVIWLGRDKHTGKPRTGGHLIVNPHEPQRWADIYVVVAGGIDEGFNEVGWYPHRQLVSKPQKDFGFGSRYAVNVTELKPPGLLKNLMKDS